MADSISRRDVLLGAAAGALAVQFPTAVLAASSDTIRIGCIVPLSGSQEVLGKPILAGAQIAAEEINAKGGVLGKKLEIIARDDQANPTVSLTAARELNGSGVNLFCGCVTSGSALALTGIMQASNAILTTCAAGSDKLNHDAFEPNFFRVTDQPYMRGRSFAKLMAQRYPSATTWGAIQPDVEYGRSAYAAFADGIKEYYPSVAKKTPNMMPAVLAKFGATDYKNQIATLMSQNLDGLMIINYGGDAVTFVQQAKTLGLIKKLKVLGDGANEWIVPAALGQATPDNLWLGMHWYYNGYLTTPLGKALYTDYVRKTGDKVPMGFLEQGHAAVLGYAAGIRKAKSTDTKAVIAAMEGMTFDTAKGKRTYRKEDHQAICDINFTEVASAPGNPGWRIKQFVRLDGADAIEPATPGKALVYKFPS